MILWEDFKHKSRCYYNREDFKSIARVIASDGSSAMILYRLVQFFQKIKLGFLGWIFLKLNKVCNGCVIGRQAEFGPGFVIMHPVGVVINGAVKGGRNIVVESGVVLGAVRSGIPVECPVLGDDIFLGSGAKVLGKIHVGNHTIIGANSVVLKDVPEGATVVGIPAQIMKIQTQRGP